MMDMMNAITNVELDGLSGLETQTLFDLRIQAIADLEEYSQDNGKYDHLSIEDFDEYFDEDIEMNIIGIEEYLISPSNVYRPFINYVGNIVGYSISNDLKHMLLDVRYMDDDDLGGFYIEAYTRRNSYNIPVEIIFYRGTDRLDRINKMKMSNKMN